MSTIYVRYNNFLGIPVPDGVEKLNAHLELLGLKNMNIGTSQVGDKVTFMMQQKFVAINYEKQAFIGSSDSFDYEIIEQDDFMNRTKGRAANKKFMGFEQSLN